MTQMPVASLEGRNHTDYDLVSVISPVRKKSEDLEATQVHVGVDDDPTSPKSRTVEAEEEKQAGFRLLSLLCAVSGLEGADTALMPAVALAMQIDLGMSFNDFASMSLCQALAGNIVAPFWGVLADRGIVARRKLLVMGCVLQGCSTLFMASAHSLGPMLFLRSMNGVMLASLRPVANGIIADTTSETKRGRTFAWIQVSMNIGAMVGGLVATPLSRHQTGGMEGWRAAFLVIGCCSVTIGIITFFFMQEPPRESVRTSEGGIRAAIVDEVRRFLSYFRLPTFCVLVLQGCFGCVPWNALNYATMFFQVGGLADSQAGAVQASQQVSGAVGSVLGGFVADNLAKRWPLHGRTMAAQFSVLSGIPIAYLIYLNTPPTDTAFIYYLCLMVIMGLFATWCGTGVNLPILSDIVNAEERSTVMAWEGALEGSCSAVFANAAVGFLAQNCFGFDVSSLRNGGQTDPESMHALGKALMLVSFIPWCLCFVAYTLLHWSYPRDLKVVAAARLKAKELEAKNPDAALEDEGDHKNPDVSWPEDFQTVISAKNRAASYDVPRKRSKSPHRLEQIPEKVRSVSGM